MFTIKITTTRYTFKSVLICLVCTSSVLVTCCGGGEAAEIVRPTVAGASHSSPVKSTLHMQQTGNKMQLVGKFIKEYCKFINAIDLKKF
jgi:hypothetical protein